MKLPPKNVLQAIALAWAILLVPAATLADGFLDDDLWYRFESGSETQVYVAGLLNTTASHITIPSTVVYEYTDGKDEDGHYIVKHRTCRVTSIASSAFMSCTSLTSVTIGNAVTSIGWGAFYNCSGLASVTIGNAVTSIGDYAFFSCSALTRVTIPDSVTSIGNYAFEYCSGLTSVTIPDSVTSIGDYAFEYCSGLTSVTIPDSVTSIGDYAFSGCSSLSSLTIPDSVTNIGKQAFTGCNSLTSVTILGNVTNDWAYYSNPFFSCNIATLAMGGKMTKIGNSLFFGCNGLASVTIPDCVTSIGDFGFSECYSLASVTIGNGVTNIGEAAFRYCTNLTSVAIGNSVKSIGDGAFYACYGLASVAIPNSVKSIGGGAFADCSGLTSVSIPDSVTNIGVSAFFWCTNLASVTIGKAVTEIGDRSFEGCSGLTSVTIPGSVKDIGCSAFGRSGLASVTFEGAPPHVEYPPFSNVAPDARGYYTAAHAAEWEVEGVIGADGKWQGLIMEMIGGMIDPPVLRMQSANPAEGSLTLAWEDPCTAAGVTYSVYRSANDTYSATDLVADGLTGTSWTDTAYWSAEPILKPLNYWVVADGGGYGERASKPVKTRNRFGVFVGLNEDQGFATDARLCRDLASEKGEFGDCTVFTGGAVDSDAIRGKVSELAEKAQPGDLFLLYISTHGGEGSLSMSGWLDDYDVAELQTDVRKFNSSVAVIGVIMACHSGSMIGNGVGTEKIISWLLDAGAADCRANIAWVTSCGYGQVSPLYGNGGSTPTPFGCSFLRDGWQKGYADGPLFGTVWKGGDGDGKVTFYELARYAAEFNKGYSDDVAPAGVRVENDELLKRMVAGTAGPGGTESQPDAPASCTASQGHSDASIQVNWELSKDATVENYWLFRKGPGETSAHCVARNAGNGEFFDPGTIRKVGESFWNPGGFSLKNLRPPEPFKIYTYYVRAVSPQGISDPSPEAMGFAGTTVMRQWLEALGISVAEGTGIASATMSANGHDSVLACYVAGLDPKDPTAAFEAELIREDGKWKAKPKGGEKEGRVYRVEGKKEMSDEDWTDVTDVEDLEADGWHFFRVGVELAE